MTAGGVPLEEIDFRTMESRKTPGLYLAGEILDCDGRIGGFNFQWAWATGYHRRPGGDEGLADLKLAAFWAFAPRGGGCYNTSQTQRRVSYGRALMQ